MKVVPVRMDSVVTMYGKTLEVGKEFILIQGDKLENRARSWYLLRLIPDLAS
jgi:hypothetical protein